jgi:hypothetical protein
MAVTKAKIQPSSEFVTNFGECVAVRNFDLVLTVTLKIQHDTPMTYSKKITDIRNEINLN